MKKQEIKKGLGVLKSESGNPEESLDLGSTGVPMRKDTVSDLSVDQVNEDASLDSTEEMDRGNAGKIGYDSFSLFDWWPDLSDLDRLNVQNAPLEERARLLSAKVSMSIEHTMQSISERKNFPLLDNFSLPENPTRHFPLRLIHAFSS